MCSAVWQQSDKFSLRSGLVVPFINPLERYGDWTDINTSYSLFERLWRVKTTYSVSDMAPLPSKRKRSTISYHCIMTALYPGNQNSETHTVIVKLTMLHARGGVSKGAVSNDQLQCSATDIQTKMGKLYVNWTLGQISWNNLGFIAPGQLPRKCIHQTLYTHVWCSVT